MRFKNSTGIQCCCVLQVFIGVQHSSSIRFSSVTFFFCAFSKMVSGLFICTQAAVLCSFQTLAVVRTNLISEMCHLVLASNVQVFIDMRIIKRVATHLERMHVASPCFTRDRHLNKLTVMFCFVFFYPKEFFNGQHITYFPFVKRAMISSFFFMYKLLILCLGVGLKYSPKTLVPYDYRDSSALLVRPPQ